MGITQQEISFLHAPALHRRELTILASRTALTGDFTRMVTLIEDGVIAAAPWITHRTDFDGLIEAFPGCVKPETGVIKAMVKV